jgi:sec-independent protein translocase protein TatC
MGLFTKNNMSANPDGQMELMEHLAELRARIFRSILYLVAGMGITYNLVPFFYTAVEQPLKPILEKVGGRLVVDSLQGGFVTYMQVCFVSGLLIAVPLVVLELWGFVKPALTAQEQQPVRFLAPFSVLLFLAGVGIAYASLPSAYGWMASYIDDIPGAALYQSINTYVLLTVKILLAFGIAFELPVVLLFLARVGLISASLMTTYWRHAIVVIATAAAILTPSNDPLTMLMMAIPMGGLYMLSIGLVRTFEPRGDGTSRGITVRSTLVITLVPVLILIATGYWLWRTAPSTSGNHPPTTPVSTPQQSDARIEALESEMKRLSDELAQLKAAQKP